MSDRSVSYHIVRCVGTGDMQKTVREALNGNDDPSWQDTKLNLDYVLLDSASDAVDYFKNKVKEDQRILAGGFRSEATDDDNLPRGRIGAVARAVNTRLARSGPQYYGNDDESVSPRRTGTAPATSGGGRGRGRPPKAAITAADESGDEGGRLPAKRGRGRPPGNKAAKSKAGRPSSASNGRKRGRPSKASKKGDESGDDDEEEESDDDDDVEQMSEKQDDETGEQQEDED